jgi:hypothetical protein
MEAPFDDAGRWGMLALINILALCGLLLCGLFVERS